MIDYDYINTLGEPLFEREIDGLGNCKFIVDGINSRVPHFIILAEDIDEAYAICLLEVLYYSHDGINSHFETYKQKEAMFSFLNEPWEWPHSEKRLVTTKWRGLLDRWVELNIGKYYELYNLLDKVPQPDYRNIIYEKPTEDDEYPLTEYWDIINGTDAITENLKYSLYNGNAVSTMAQIIAIIDGGDSVKYDHGSIEGVEIYYDDETGDHDEPEPDTEDDATKLTNLIEHGAGPQYIEGITVPEEYVTLVNGGDENYHVIASFRTDYNYYTSSNVIMKTFTFTNPFTHSTVGTLYTRTGTSKGICFDTIKTNSTNSYISTTTYSNATTSGRSSTVLTSTDTFLRTISTSSNELKRTKYYIKDSIPEYETYTNRTMYTISSSYTDSKAISVFTSSYAGLSRYSTKYYNKRTTLISTNYSTYLTTSQAGSSTVENIVTVADTLTYRTYTRYISTFQYMVIPTKSSTMTLNKTFTYIDSGTTRSSLSLTTGTITYPVPYLYTSSQTCTVLRTITESGYDTTQYTLTDATSSTEYESRFTTSRTAIINTTSPTTYKISNTFSRSRTAETIFSTLTSGTSRQTCTSIKSTTSSGVTARSLYSSVNGSSTIYYTLTTGKADTSYTSLRTLSSYTSYYKTFTAKTVINDDTTSTYSTTAATTTSGVYYVSGTINNTTTTSSTTPIYNTSGSIYYETNRDTIIVDFTTTSRYTGTMYNTSSNSTTSSYATFDYIISNLTNTRTSTYNNVATATYGQNETATVRYTTSSVYYD